MPRCKYSGNPKNWAHVPKLVRTCRSPGFDRQTNNHDVVYTPDELEFLKAVDQYKREFRRPYPTWKEILSLLKSLGYRKAPIDPDEPLIVEEPKP